MIGPETFIILFFAAFIGGFVDAIAGGGGLITVPALLLTGLNPVSMLATNKLQSVFGSFSAFLYFFRKNMIHVRSVLKTIMMIFFGSSLGAIVLLFFDSTKINIIIPILLIMISFYYIFFSHNLDKKREERCSQRIYNIFVAPFLGFYDGFFGPGTGSIMATSLVLLRGMTLIEATAYAKLFNFVSNISALALFISSGRVVWLVGGVMILGQFIGAYFGARTAFLKGSSIIRPLLIGMCLLMSLKVLWSSF